MDGKGNLGVVGVWGSDGLWLGLIGPKRGMRGVSIVDSLLFQR